MHSIRLLQLDKPTALLHVQHLAFLLSFPHYWHFLKDIRGLLSPTHSYLLGSSHVPTAQVLSFEAVPSHSSGSRRKDSRWQERGLSMTHPDTPPEMTYTALLLDYGGKRCQSPIRKHMAGCVIASFTTVYLISFLATILIINKHIKHFCDLGE